MEFVELGTVVVAHPDDEVLWFSSLLERCKRVVVCFGPSASGSEPYDAGRAALMDSYPLSKVKFLRLPQSDAYQEFNWKKPRTSVNGELLLAKPNLSYDANSVRLTSILAEELRDEEVIFSHNPWGEYGHEEHVQVFSALRKLSKERPFEHFVSSYCSNRSHTLMTRSMHMLARDGHLVLSTNGAMADRMKGLYSDFDCWTWMPDYKWPSIELFLKVAQQPRNGTQSTTASVPLNYISYRFTHSVPELIASRLLPEQIKRAMRRKFGA